jgi:hypothetical protein
MLQIVKTLALTAKVNRLFLEVSNLLNFIIYIYGLGMQLCYCYFGIYLFVFCFMRCSWLLGDHEQNRVKKLT